MDLWKKVNAMHPGDCIHAQIIFARIHTSNKNTDYVYMMKFVIRIAASQPIYYIWVQTYVTLLFMSSLNCTMFNSIVHPHHIKSAENMTMQPSSIFYLQICIHHSLQCFLLIRTTWSCTGAISIPLIIGPERSCTQLCNGYGILADTHV